MGLVALLVVGPERLPRLAYTAGKWLSKGRTMLNSVKAEINKEMKAEELKEILAEQKKKLNPLEEVIEETSVSMQELKNETEVTMRSAQEQHSSEKEPLARSGDSDDASADESHDEKDRSGG